MYGPQLQLASELVNDRTGKKERVFPASAPSVFEARLPGLDTLELLRADSRSQALLAIEQLEVGAKRIPATQALVNLQLSDLTSALQLRTMKLATRWGITDPGVLGALPDLYNVALGSVQSIVAGELSLELMGKEVLRVLPQLLQQANIFPGWANMLAQVGVVLFDVVSSVTTDSEPEFDSRRLPIVTHNSRGDEVVMNQLAAYIDAKDMTGIFCPAQIGQFEIEHAGKLSTRSRSKKLGPSAPWGYNFGRRIPGDPATFTNSGYIGGAPGVAELQGTAQLDLQRLSDGTGGDASWYTMRCRWARKPCWKNRADFRGKRRCKRCQPIDSLRGTSRGRWQDFITSPVRSHATNLAGWYWTSAVSSNGIWAGLEDTRAPYCVSVDLEQVNAMWEDHYRELFDAGRRLWNRWDAYGWRFVVSNFLALGLVSVDDGAIGGRGTSLDWRRGWDTKRPPTVHADWAGDNKAGKPTPYTWANSVYMRLIRPRTEAAARAVLFSYETLAVAYQDPRAPAHFDASTGKPRENKFGRARAEGIKGLLSSPRRFEVRLSWVQDEALRDALLASGVNPYAAGKQIQAGPTTPTYKPPRQLPGRPELVVREGLGAALAMSDPNLPPGLDTAPTDSLVGCLLNDVEQELEDGPAQAAAERRRAALLSGLSVAGAGATLALGHLIERQQRKQ